jgi:hypothetical protein
LLHAAAVLLQLLVSLRRKDVSKVADVALGFEGVQVQGEEK